MLSKIENYKKNSWIVAVAGTLLIWFCMKYCFGVYLLWITPSVKMYQLSDVLNLKELAELLFFSSPIFIMAFSGTTYLLCDIDDSKTKLITTGAVITTMTVMTCFNDYIYWEEYLRDVLAGISILLPIIFVLKENNQA